MLRRLFVVLMVLGFVFSLGDSIYASGWRYDLKDYSNAGHGPGEVIDAQKPQSFNVPVMKEGKDYLQFFAIGCAGSGNEGQRIIGRRMSEVASKEDVSFVLYLGDNFYGRGVDSVKDKKWKTQFEDIYFQDSLQIPFYAVLGNHGYHKNPLAQVEYGLTNERWKMPDRFYRFSKTLPDGTEVDFFGIDTEAIINKSDAKQLVWLDRELKRSDADWKIVYGHHPLYTGDKFHHERAEKARILLEPILMNNKVDLYLSAHSHNIQAFRPIKGINHLVTGAASRPRDLRWIENTIFASADLGVSWLRISKEKIDVLIIDKEGKTQFAYEISPKI